MMLRKLKSFLTSQPLIRNVYRLRFSSLDLQYKPEDLNYGYYQKVADLGDAELEHQIGRLTNFKTILTEIARDNLAGDVLELGTWRGFSLLWIAYLCERLGIFKKIISIDSFAGLPHGEGAFEKGMFSDASLEIARQNIYRSRDLYDATKRNIFIEKFLYSEKEKVLKRLDEIGCKKFVFIHFDCDISSSVTQALGIVREVLADQHYQSFDDYGFGGKFSDTVDSAMKEMSQQWDIREYSSTKLTKNFKLTKKS